MRLLAWIYINVWMRFWIWRWKDTPDYLPDGFPVDKSLWCPRWLQPALVAEMTRDNQFIPE